MCYLRQMSVKAISWKLPEFMTANSITANDLRKATLGIGSTVIYAWAKTDHVPERIHLHALEAVLEALERITGKPVKLTDILEWENDPS